MSVSYHMTSLNVESKKKSYKGTYLHNRKRLTDLENELMVARERDMQGLGKGHVHTALFKMDNQEAESRWRKNRTGDHFLFYKFIERTTER